MQHWKMSTLYANTVGNSFVNAVSNMTTPTNSNRTLLLYIGYIRVANQASQGDCQASAGRPVT
jgi:hypothetical protein